MVVRDMFPPERETRTAPSPYIRRHELLLEVWDRAPVRAFRNGFIAPMPPLSCPTKALKFRALLQRRSTKLHARTSHRQALEALFERNPSSFRRLAHRGAGDVRAARPERSRQIDVDEDDRDAARAGHRHASSRRHRRARREGRDATRP